MRTILLPLAVIVCFTANSQSSNRCGSTELIKKQMAINPVYSKKVQDAQRNQGNYSRKSNANGQPVTVTIPVAVHVLYYSPDQNVSDAQVQSQIDVLNEDFTATNKDYRNYDAGYGSVKGDMDIKFCLVAINHKQTAHQSFAVTDNMKFSNKGGDDAIDPMHVLNIWVCNLKGGVLGFAYYPGITPEKFGVVCHTFAFGRGSQYNLLSRFNLGRTVTHEIGHCFGLVHIWGDAHCGNDQVDDTPLHNDPNLGCPGEGHLSTCQGTPLEMWMNYMDYTDDRCMYFFSDGQVARSNSFIDTDPQLQSIVASACTTTVANTTFASPGNRTVTSLRGSKGTFVVYPSLTTGEITIDVNATRSGAVTLNVYNQAGALVIKKQIAVVEGMNTKTMDLSRLQNGMYILQLNQDNLQSVNKLIVQH